MAVRAITEATSGRLRHDGMEAVMNAPVHARCTHWLADNVLPHESALRRWLRWQVPMGLEVDDVVQEAYALIAAQDRVERILEPRAYLFTVARSVVLRHVRRSRLISIDTNTDIAREHHELTPERHAGASQELCRLVRMIGGLPPRCRQAFVMGRVEQLPQDEVARRMGLSRSSVEKHLARASSLLAERMAQANRPSSHTKSCTGAHDGDLPRSLRMSLRRATPPFLLREGPVERSPAGAPCGSARGKGMRPPLEERGNTVHVMQHSPSLHRHAG